MIKTDPFYLNEQISKIKMSFQAYVNVDDEGDEQTFPTNKPCLLVYLKRECYNAYNNETYVKNRSYTCISEAFV